MGRQLRPGARAWQIGVWGTQNATHLLHLDRTADVDRLLALVELLLEPVDVVGPCAGKLGGRAASATPHLGLADVSSVFVGVVVDGAVTGERRGRRGRERVTLVKGAENEVGRDTGTQEAMELGQLFTLATALFLGELVGRQAVRERGRGRRQGLPASPAQLRRLHQDAIFV